jgi:hypothetical protein
MLYVAIFCIIVGGYALLRPTLKNWFPGFFAWIEPVELALFKKSETIFFARLKILTGLLLTTLTQLGTIDITPLMPLVPDKWEGTFRVVWNLLPMTLTVLGMIDEKLRNGVSLPIEVVAVAEKDKTPAVEAAIANVEIAKEQAVAVIAVETVKT